MAPPAAAAWAPADIDRYLPTATELSSKPAACRCCYRSTGWTDGRTNGHPAVTQTLTACGSVNSCVGNDALQFAEFADVRHADLSIDCFPTQTRSRLETFRRRNNTTKLLWSFNVCRQRIRSKLVYSVTTTYEFPFLVKKGHNYPNRLEFTCWSASEVNCYVFADQ